MNFKCKTAPQSKVSLIKGIWGNTLICFLFADSEDHYYSLSMLHCLFTTQTFKSHAVGLSVEAAEGNG